MKRVPFIVVGSQRTGSTLVRTSLDHHPLIKCSGEVFLFPGSGDESYPRFLAQSVGRRAMHYIWRRKPVFDFLDQLYAQSGYQALGFKFMYSQARRVPYRTPMVMDYVRRYGIRVIHVTRSNVLKTYISRVTSKATGIYHSKGDEVKREQITLPLDTLLLDLEKIQKLDGQWIQKLSDLPYLNVVYEDFVGQPEAVSRQLHEFLDIDDDRTLCSPHRKVNPDALEQVIKNYRQVRELLIDSPFSYCLS